MGNATSTQPIVDNFARITHPLIAERVQGFNPMERRHQLENLVHETPFPRLRYVQILLDQGKLGPNIIEIVKNCVSAIHAHKACTEYIKVVFDHIHAKVQDGSLDQAEGTRMTKRIIVAVRSQSPQVISADRVKQAALDLVVAEALQRLPAHAVWGW